jgi:EAL domain-containing protein (putative c-di-GMP-specific phosphodiesterase class I)
VVDSLSDIGDPKQLIQRVADEALALLPGAEGVLVGLLDDDSLTFVCGSGCMTPGVGAAIEVLGSLAGASMSSGDVLSCDDTESDPRVDREACRRFGVLSTVCAPMERGGASLGVLCVSSSRRAAFNNRDVATLGQLAQFMGTVVGAATDLAKATTMMLPGRGMRGSPYGWTVDDASDDIRAVERFVANVLNPGSFDFMTNLANVERFLDTGTFNFAFQPIFDLGSGSLAVVEALARFPFEPRKPPDVWFATAHRVGLGVELELAAVKAALESLDLLPAGVRMAINVGPEAISSPELPAMLARVDRSRIVLELTEQVKVDDYPRLRVALMEVRGAGTTLAIDDAGAGYASLSHILKLAPDFIKLDLTLTQGIDVDPVRRALAMSLVNFAQDTGARIISEGIETDDELATLRELGIHFGQGYLLGRPGPIEAVPVALLNLGPRSVGTAQLGPRSVGTGHRHRL